MSEYWKSTPTYWCKFCSTYVRDTTLEKKNHEATPKHQNNIQRSLRELHKTKEREGREAQRAKDEVNRLNALVSGQEQKQTRPSGTAEGTVQKAPTPATTGAKLSAAEQRKVHAEQLAALGVDLPDELKREVTGVGGWQVVSERVVDTEPLAGIKDGPGLEGEDSKSGITSEGASKGVHKRKADEAEEEEEELPRRKAWGSKFKSYAGANGDRSADDDLEALLGGVRKREPDMVKKEEPLDVLESSTLGTIDSEGNTLGGIGIKREDGAKTDNPVTVVFKKRKAKR